jgi:hypothetical protein
MKWDYTTRLLHHCVQFCGYKPVGDRICDTHTHTHTHKKWLPLWYSGQSSWLQIQRSGFDSRRYQIFWEVVGLEQGPLSLASIIEELLERKSSGSGLETRHYGRRDPSRWLLGTLHLQKFVLTLLTSCGRSVGIVHSRTQAAEFSFFFYI